MSKCQEAVVVLGPIEQALEREFGHVGNVPDGLELRTDHGPQYTGADCQALCDRWGLDHTLAPVGRPTGNAVAELATWVHEYNHERPHQALQWNTPADQRALNLGRTLQAVA
jgi:putative transposase